MDHLFTFAQPKDSKGGATVSTEKISVENIM
jgi:hypothetical protein